MVELLSTVEICILREKNDEKTQTHTHYKSV